MSFSSAQKGARLIETIENYSKLHTPLTDNTPYREEAARYFDYYDDHHFWKKILKKPEAYWNISVDVFNAVLSEWVARIPGLYWHQQSAAVRVVPDAYIEKKHSNIWTQYNPIGKSHKVMGGIGTFVLPPDDAGNVLFMISTSHNASTGVPILIKREIIEALHLQQGDILIIRGAVWRKMSDTWANRFPSMQGIPRGYLIVDSAQQIDVKRRKAPVEIHPCSIIEYSDGNSLLFDFTFCTVDTGLKNYRKEITSFFDRYRFEYGRYGRYLLAADVNDPLFEAEYNSPADLLRNAAGGRDQMALLTERIRSTFFYKDHTLSSVIDEVSARYVTPEQIQALCIQLCIPYNQLQQTAAAHMAVQLVNRSRELHKLEELVDAITIKN